MTYTNDRSTLKMAESSKFVPGGGTRGEIVDSGSLLEKRLAKQRRCGKYRKPGHNSRICQEYAELFSKSDADN